MTNKKNTDKKEINKKSKTKIKNAQETKTETQTQNNEMVKLLKIVLIVTGIMLVFYGITLLVTKKSEEVLENKETKEQTQKTGIQYKNIMIGTMLNHGGTYYVLIEEKDDNRITEYDSLITTIESSEDAPRIYKANLTDSFNKTYLGKEENYYVENLNEFKVTGTTLVKVKDGRIEVAKDTYDSIKNTLKEIA